MFLKPGAVPPPPRRPVTIRSASSLAKPAAAGVAIRPNTDPRAAKLEDMSEWSAQQFKPSIPGQTMASTAANHATSISMSTRPGSYELHFICDGPTGARFSMSSNGAGTVDPVGVPCNGVTLRRPLTCRRPGRMSAWRRSAVLMAVTLSGWSRPAARAE